jgi:nicotinamidase-related amidase
MKPALLVIDVQQGIDDALHWGGSRNNPEAEGNILLLLNTWRSKNLPVFIIQHFSTDGQSPFRPSHPGNLLKDFIFVLPGEELIRKSTANAFLNTTLKDRLVERNIREVVIVGFVTNNSVESTARMSGEMGFKTFVVSDATASFNKKGLDGEIYPSELVHQLSLSNLKTEFAEIQTTQQIISSIQ